MLTIFYKDEPLPPCVSGACSEEKAYKIRQNLEFMHNDYLIDKFIKYNYFDTEDQEFVVARFNQFLKNYRLDYAKYGSDYLYHFCDIDEVKEKKPTLYYNSVSDDLDTNKNWIDILSKEKYLKEKQQNGDFLYCDNDFSFSLLYINNQVVNEDCFSEIILSEDNLLNGMVKVDDGEVKIDDSVLIDYVNELGLYYAGREYIQRTNKGEFIDLSTNKVIQNLHAYIINLNSEDPFLQGLILATKN